MRNEQYLRSITEHENKNETEYEIENQLIFSLAPVMLHHIDKRQASEKNNKYTKTETNIITASAIPTALKKYTFISLKVFKAIYLHDNAAGIFIHFLDFNFEFFLIGELVNRFSCWWFCCCCCSKSWFIRSRLQNMVLQLQCT